MQVNCPHCGKPFDNPIPASSSASLSVEERNILQLLDVVPETDEGPTSDIIASHVSIEAGKVRFLLDELEERSLVGFVMDMDEGSQYHITKEGRRALYS